MNTTLFNLIAVLYAEINLFEAPKPTTSISKDFLDAIEEKAKNLIYDKLIIKNSESDNRICVNPQGFDDIIIACQEENDFLFFRSVLCHLDLLINMEELIKKYDFNNYENYDANKMFESLNDNIDKTNIVVIPKVATLPSTFCVKAADAFEDKEYKNAYHWNDNINNHFHKIICINKDDLSGYRINNVLINIFKNHDINKIVIGVTPCCNIPTKQIMDIDEYCNEETQTQHFRVKQYYNPKKLTEYFLKSLSVAKENNVDIFMGAEMLGTLDLSKTDDTGYNHFFRDQNGQAPHIIVTPSVWVDGKNFISVYSNSGELIGNQYKQNSFEYTDDGIRYEEDLIDIPKEILLIHIPGWGRIVFPICVDFLVTNYRDLLVRELKANLVLCPSYSSGTVQFANASGAIREFDSRLVWLNSCSALSKFSQTPPPAVGLVAVPITSPYDLTAPSKEIKPECNGVCSDCCMFTITIYAKSTQGKHCNEVEIKHVPL